MRILCTFVGGLGHLAPLLPLTRAAQAAGHEVAVAGSGGLVPRIEGAGFRAYATSPQPHHAGAPATRVLTPLTGTDARAAEVEFAENFGDRGARRMAAAVPGVIEDFAPDLVLRDETDLGTTIAAELLGVPVATNLVLASGLLVRPELAGPRLDAVRAEHGLPPDPGLGRELDPAGFGPQPPHVRLERFVPQEDLLHEVDLVVSHGGSGSLMAALAHGLPSVLLPLGADQPHNARRAEELGVATSLDAATATPEEIGSRVRTALAGTGTRERCRSVADELCTLPDVGAAVSALEDAARPPRGR